MQSSRAGADRAPGRQGRSAPPGARSSVGRGARATRRPRPGYPLPRVRFVTGVALIAALAMATVGIQAYVRAGHQQARITALEGELAGLQRRIGVDEQGAASERRHVRSVAAQADTARRALSRVDWALQSLPSAAQIADVRSQLAVYASCIPQLQSEIAGLGITWRIDRTRPSADYFRLSTSSPISRSCRS
jgi:hypothetical protein